MHVFKVDKMKCEGCAAKVQQALQAADPHAQVRVDLGAKQVEVDSTLPAVQLRALIEQAGYPVSGAAA